MRRIWGNDAVVKCQLSNVQFDPPAGGDIWEVECMKKEILLQLKNIKVHYGGVKALDDVSLSLDEGEIVALIGPNGAGKSTILKALFGLALIEHGSVLWHEQEFTPVSHEVVKKGIAFVPQGRRVFSHLTVKENLEIGAYGVKEKTEIERRMNEVLETFPALKQKIKAQAGTLSGGQQQMLAIGRGLMADPKVLLLDEPSLGLAPKMVKEVFVKIQEINNRHQTAILIVEHNLQSLFKIAHRVYVLDRGVIVSHGTPKDIESMGIVRKVFLGTTM